MKRNKVQITLNSQKNRLTCISKDLDLRKQKTIRQAKKTVDRLNKKLKEKGGGGKKKKIALWRGTMVRLVQAARGRDGGGVGNHFQFFKLRFLTALEWVEKEIKGKRGTSFKKDRVFVWGETGQKMLLNFSEGTNVTWHSKRRAMLKSL